MLTLLVITALVIAGVGGLAVTAFLVHRALIRWADAIILSFDLLRLCRRRRTTNTHDCPPPPMRPVEQSVVTGEVDARR